jgi:hypothetical protein
LVGRDLDLEQNVAVDQEAQERESREVAPAAQLADPLRRYERRQNGGNLGIPDLEQCAGARRFQHHRIGAAPQIGKARQHDTIGVAQRGGTRPIVGDLRLDDHLIAASRTREPIFHKAMGGQAVDQTKNFRIEFAAACGQRRERQTAAQRLRLLGRGGADRAQTEGEALNAGDGLAAGARLQRDMAKQPHGKRRWRRASPTLGVGSAQAASLKYEDEAD